MIAAAIAFLSATAHPIHMHADHFSSVTENGKMVFPNATIFRQK
ncbi:hypothetical protein [Cricetibacter osteomyelitidis]|nr:hypothetical protein [Cricetibacter osteomyelitidis]